MAANIRIIILYIFLWIKQLLDQLEEATDTYNLRCLLLYMSVNAYQLLNMCLYILVQNLRTLILLFV